MITSDQKRLETLIDELDRRRASVRQELDHVQAAAVSLVSRAGGHGSASLSMRGGAVVPASGRGSGVGGARGGSGRGASQFSVTTSISSSPAALSASLTAAAASPSSRSSNDVVSATASASRKVRPKLYCWCQDAAKQDHEKYPMISCDNETTCRGWAHKACEDLGPAARASRGAYICKGCRGIAPSS